MSLSDVKNMSTVERLQAMESLWDALCHEEHKLQSPDWHCAVLEERRQQIAAGEAKWLSLDELKKRLRR
jgi:putative addiction module component (TIGR02574 family)